MTIPYTPTFGPMLLDGGRTRFRLWAPNFVDGTVPSVQVAAQPPVPMVAQDAAGWFAADVEATVGARYRFVLPATPDRAEPLSVADPASQLQDGDVHGASVVTDGRDYPWKEGAWRGRPWQETVLYELHVGLCGGFAGVERQLPALAALGITAVELMPIADFPGTRNWGYDGVLPYAPESSYGTPDELRSLIDTAHGLGLMVFLDVVYNHFGPDGNYLHAYAERFFRDDIHTPWGPAIDYRQDDVRRFFTENALYWVQHFRFDGLRFDAVHEIADAAWLDEMARTVRAAVEPERHVHLVLEHDGNAASHLGAPFDAQWNDDAHHVLHVLLTGEEVGYYGDYADRPAEKLARWLSQGFVYQGEPSPYRKGVPRGTPSSHLPPSAFVNCLQNHDQIGNRAFGERLLSLTSPAAVCAGAALLLLCPQIPMLFMGEEAGVRHPFLYFTDHGIDLANAVHEGRQREFAQFPAFAEATVRERIPNPNDDRTYEACRLDPEPADADVPPDAAGWRAYYRRLLHIRRTAIVPLLTGARSIGAEAIGPAVCARWSLGDGSELTIWTNLCAASSPLDRQEPPIDTERTCLFDVPPGAADVLVAHGRLPPWSTVAILTQASGHA